jgi:ABC-type transport system, involved in lipoprotein release, permease component
LNFLFAWRYFKARKTTNAINIIAWISIVAIIIGTASLILVLSVFNGFEGLVKSLYSSFYPELKISPASGKHLTLSEDQIKAIRGTGGIKNISLVVEERAFLQNKNDSGIIGESMIYIKGVDDNYGAVTKVPDHIVEGSFDVGDEENPLLVLGAGIQNAVGIRSDRNIRPLTLYMPRKGSSDLSDPLQSLSEELVNTSGSFVIQQDFDNKYVLSNLAFVKKMLALNDNEYGAVEISVDPKFNINKIEDELKKRMGPRYLVQNRFEQNASLYTVMKIEKWFIYAILSLILTVAAFNMVGALTMLVLEKKQDISVLKALGADKRIIQRIFLTEGMLLATIGGGSGMLLAFVMGTLQKKFHMIPLQGSTFMIDYFPVKMVLSDFILVGCTVFIIALFASWLPARKAALQQLNLREE